MKKKILAGIFSAAVIGAAIITFAEIDLTAVSDGTYIGEYVAGMVSAKVQVTVEGNAIKEIKLSGY